ncbi:MAG TPA: GNAT family N-acetyltransferase [Pirellulales bacterium]|nr:GNAT family N-acetyltransferase [Pirellulales bacterium]
MLRIVPIDNEAQLHQFAGAWDRLAGRMPFRGWVWNECWWRHYRGPSDRLHVLALEDRTGQVRGLAPWYVGHSPWLGRVVRFLGTGEVCSEHLTILCEPGWQTPVVDALAYWLSQDHHRHWDTLELEGIDGENTTVHALVAALVERRHRVHRQPTINAWRVNLPETWDEYLAQFTSRRRERLRRAFRRKFDTGEAQLRMADDLESLAVGWPAFELLHNRRRESQGQPGCFASPRFAAFHREVAPRLLASDQLRLEWLELKGCPAAAEYGLCDDQTIYCYQTGFEPNLAEESPGWLAFGSSIQRAIHDGYRWFDFLRGDEAYKATWKAVPRELATLRIFARHLRGRARIGAWSLGQQLKKSWRQCRNTPPAASSNHQIADE